MQTLNWDAALVFYIYISMGSKDCQASMFVEVVEVGQSGGQWVGRKNESEESQRVT